MRCIAIQIIVAVRLRGRRLVKLGIQRSIVFLTIKLDEVARIKLSITFSFNPYSLFDTSMKQLNLSWIDACGGEASCCQIIIIELINSVLGGRNFIIGLAEIYPFITNLCNGIK